MKKAPVLNYYSYDSISNPWLGGGGSYRDIEMLSRYTDYFSSVNLIAGHYPGCSRKKIGGINFIPLGFGRNEIISRITFVLRANLHILFSRKDAIGLNLSAYAPLFTSLFFRNKCYAVVHHFIGRNWVSKMPLIFKPLGWCLYGFECWLFKMSKNVVVSNSVVKNIFIRLNPKVEILLSSNGFNDALLALPDKTVLEKPFILYVGRIDLYMKGLDILLEAFEKLARINQTVQLVMAGKADSENAKLLSRQISSKGLSERVTFLQNISEEQKHDLLSRCLFFVSPSRYEGFGIAALEANAAGKLVVASQADGFKNSIKDGYSGFLVDVNHPNQLMDTIKSLVEDSELRNKMNRNAREWASRFSWDKIKENELAWIQEKVLGGIK